MRLNFRTLLIFSSLLVAAPHSKATQDVEDPQHIIGYIRLMMSEPIVAAEILRLARQGCAWDSEVFWSGSPSEENLKTRIFWMNFSMQVATKNGSKYWKSFTFSRKDGGPILEIIETTNKDKVIDCSD